MKFDVKTWLIIGLTVVIVLLILFQPSKPDEGKQPYLDSVKVLKADKAIIAAQIERVIETSNYKAKVSDSLLVLKEKEISRLKAKAATAVEQIPVRVMEENPEIGFALRVQYDLIEKQSALIDTLKNQLAFERGVRENLVALYYDQAKIEYQMSELKDVRIIQLEKDLKREKRKGKFKAVLVPIVGGLAFLLGSQL